MTAVPQVSVCIPARNSAAFLGEAIESVLAQDYGDFELIVCDNASDDETAEICARYKDPRFRVARFEEPVGQAANWNRCLDLASGKYVLLLHADDELRPQFLERTVDVLESNPDVGLVHCAAQHIDEGGADLELQALFEADVVDRDDRILHRLLLEGCVINPAGVIARRTAFERVGRFTDQVVWGVDWHMWIRIAMEFAVGYVAEPLSRYRQHTSSGTSGVMTSARNGKDERWVIEDVFRIVAKSRPELGSLRSDARRGVATRTWWMAERMCREGEMKASRAGIRQAVRTDPRLLANPRIWALFVASYLGYGSFDRMRGWKRWEFARRR